MKRLKVNLYEKLDGSFVRCLFDGGICLMVKKLGIRRTGHGSTRRTSALERSFIRRVSTFTTTE